METLGETGNTVGCTGDTWLSCIHWKHWHKQGDATLKALGCNTGCWLQVILATLGGTGDTCSFINVRFTVKEIKQAKNETVKLTNMKKESRDLSKEKKYFILLFAFFCNFFVFIYTEVQLQFGKPPPAELLVPPVLGWTASFCFLKGQNVLSVNSLCCMMEMSALCTAAADKLTSESPAGDDATIKKKKEMLQRVDTRWHVQENCHVSTSHLLSDTVLWNLGINHQSWSYVCHCHISGVANLEQEVRKA